MKAKTTISMTLEEFDQLCIRVRKDERRRCTEALCIYCSGTRAEFYHTPLNVDGEWVHYLRPEEESMYGRVVQCDADVIWEMEVSDE